MKATRELKVILELAESEANDLYLAIDPKSIPNCSDKIKIIIQEALGYEPLETPDL